MRLSSLTVRRRESCIFGFFNSIILLLELLIALLYSLNTMDSDENLLPLTLLLDRSIRSMYDGDEVTEDDAMNPIDENDCCNQADGGMTLDEYGVEEFLEEQDDNEDQAQQNILLSLIMHALHEEEEAQQHGHKFRKKIERMRALRRPKTTRKKAAELKFFTDPITGNCCPMTPKLSSWWIWYIQDPKPESIQGAKMFRSRFRLPYASFVQLCRCCVNEVVAYSKDGQLHHQKDHISVMMQQFETLLLVVGLLLLFRCCYWEA